MIDTFGEFKKKNAHYAEYQIIIYTHRYTCCRESVKNFTC